MSYISLKCKNCGASMSIDMNAKYITCSHCGSTFMLSELFDSKDLDLVEKLGQDDIERKINFAEALKEGESCIYKSEYVKAEQFFKRAIELDESSYKGYFGVVRAKTHNFNILPDSNDYAEYAKFALKLVDKDDQNHIKSELEKLKLLKQEKKQIEQTKRQKQASQETKEQIKQKTESFFSKLACFFVVFIAAAVLFFIFLIKDDTASSQSNAQNYEISSVADFEKLYSDSSLLSATIILKNDLDFNGKTLEPIGTDLKPFSGCFYGNGKKLSNFKINNPNTNEIVNIGLFGVTKNASISGITLDNASLVDTKSNAFYAHCNLGFICGKSQNTTFRKCAVLDTCQIDFNQLQNASFSIGGIVGNAQNGTVINLSYSNADIAANFDNVSFAGTNSMNFSIGGIAGTLDRSKISNSYSSSDMTANIECVSNDSAYCYAGGIAGKVTYSLASDFYINSCFFNGTINNNLVASSKHQYISGIVGFGAGLEEMNSNFVLFSGENFVQNNSSLLLSQICDNFGEQSPIVFVNSSDDMIEKIENLLSTNDWDNTSSLTPTLKFVS